MESPTAISIKKMGVDEIISRKDDPEIGFVLASANVYVDKIDGLSITERSTKCLGLAQAVLTAIYSKKEEEVDPCLYKALIDISRSGLHAQFTQMMGPPPEKYWGVNVYGYDFNGNPDDVKMFTPYNYFIALGHYGYRRPYEALNSLNQTISGHNRMMEMMKKGNCDPAPIFGKILIDYHILRIKIWRDISENLEPNLKRDAYSVIIGAMQDVANDLEALEEKKAAAAYRAECAIFAKRRNLSPKSGGIRADLAGTVDEDTASYEDWCWKNRYWLTPMNEFSHVPRREWMKDTIGWGTTSSNQIRIKDIIRTYSHCRRILFEYTRIPRAERVHMTDDDMFDRLLDCYLRLYSILDKTMKLIALDILHEKPVTELDYKNLPKYWDLEYNEVFKKKQNRCKYLRFITDLNRDLSVDEKDRDRGFIDSFYVIHRVKLTPGNIRNLMIHSAVEIIDSDQKERERKTNIITISPMDLEVEVKKLMMQVRELLLGINLAMYKGAGRLPD